MSSLVATLAGLTRPPPDDADGKQQTQNANQTGDMQTEISAAFTKVGLERDVK